MGKIKKTIVGLGSAAVVATGVLAYNSGENNSNIENQDTNKVVIMQPTSKKVEVVKSNNDVVKKNVILSAKTGKPVEKLIRIPEISKEIVNFDVVESVNASNVLKEELKVTHNNVVKPKAVQKKSVKPVKVKAFLGKYEYSLDLNSDGQVDLIGLEKKGNITTVKDGLTGVISRLHTDMVRNDLFQIFRYSSNPRVENGSIPSSYLITQNGGDEELIKYLVETNNVKGIKTKLTNALEVVSIVDKVANSYVRGQYLREHLIDEIKRDPSLLVKKVEDKKENAFSNYIDSLSQTNDSSLNVNKQKNKKLQANKLVKGKPLMYNGKQVSGHVTKGKPLMHKGIQISNVVSKPTIQIGNYVEKSKEHKKIPTEMPKGKGLESIVQGNLAPSSTYDKVAYQIKNNAKAREIYSGSFGDDVQIQDLILAMGAGSAIIVSANADYLPSVQADAALSKSRGANMNTYVMKINEGGRNGLLGSSIKTLNSFKEMYQKQIEATTTQINKLEKF